MTGQLSTGIIMIVILVICVFSIKSYARKLAGGGCCGQSEKKVKVHDRNLSHYPQHVLVSVEGMHCAQCALRIENAFGRLDGVYAKADGKHGKVDVYMKQMLSDQKIASVIQSLGYMPRHLEHIS